MSTHDNKAVLLHAIEKFNDPRDREGYFNLYGPGAVLHGYPGVEPGIEGIKRFYRAYWTAFPDVALTVDLVLAEGDLVACSFAVRQTHRGEFMGIPPTGKSVTYSGVTILRFAAGKCIERWSQADFLGMLQQLGVVPGIQ